jgi:hypothetical protein
MIGIVPSSEVLMLCMRGVQNQIIGAQKQDRGAGASVITSRLNQQRAPTMNRDDVFLWLSIFWFVALCGAAIWALISF